MFRHRFRLFHRTFLQCVSRPAVLWPSFVVVLIIFVAFNATHLPFSVLSLKRVSGGHTILNLLPLYGADEAYDHIASYGSEGVAIYKQILLIDAVLMIPSYVAFLSGGLVSAGRKSLGNRHQRVIQALTLLPLLAGLLNYMEDIVVLFLMSHYPQRFDWAARFCGALTTAKGLFIAISLLIVVSLYLARSNFRKQQDVLLGR